MIKAQHSVTFSLGDCCVAPDQVVWNEPYAWTNGEPTHFSVFHAHIATHKTSDGYVYTVRRCSLRVLPPEEPH
jgi:hypothetical protein